ncbi:MAG: BON domain-containing protein [Pyrinomonadaceae bacterium]
MRSIRSLFLAAIAVVGIFGTAALAQSGSIDNQIYHKVRGLTYYNTFDYITWQVNGSTVTLNGKVATLGTRSEAARAVKDIPGVREVVNNIEELPPSSFDDQIRRRALFEFTQHGPGQYFGWPNPDVHIIVENGRMTLEGYVARKSDSDMLNILANGIQGVFEVTNNLKIGERPKA